MRAATRYCLVGATLAGMCGPAAGMAVSWAFTGAWTQAIVAAVLAGVSGWCAWTERGRARLARMLGGE